MKFHASSLRLCAVVATCALLAGCLLKPSTVATRSFVLAPIPAGENRPATAGQLPIGIGLIKVPPYLLRSSLVLRLDTNEIQYLESALWAERLDSSFQRTLAVNLGLLLPTDQIRLSSWQRTDVALAVFVALEQFDVDAQGRGTLIAWWRITSPAGDKILKSGQSRLTRNGPPGRPQPEAIVGILNELTAELSRKLAEAIRESAPAAQTHASVPDRSDQFGADRRRTRSELATVSSP